MKKKTNEWLQKTLIHGGDERPFWCNGKEHRWVGNWIKFENCCAKCRKETKDIFGK
jgi:hypothetical protein